MRENAAARNASRGLQITPWVRSEHDARLEILQTMLTQYNVFQDSG